MLLVFVCIRLAWVLQARVDRLNKGFEIRKDNSKDSHRPAMFTEAYHGSRRRQFNSLGVILRTILGMLVKSF